MLPKLSRNTLKLESEAGEFESDDSDDDGSACSDDDKSDGGDCETPESVAMVEEVKERIEEFNELTPVEYILAPPRVRGFDLRTKEWCMGPSAHTIFSSVANPD